MKVEHVFIQIARPSGRGAQRFGITEEGWFTQDGNVVTLCDQDGLAKLDYNGRRVQAPVREGENARQVAGRLLRSASQHKHRSFNRAINYRPLGNA
jgi:hypothetical protein